LVFGSGEGFANGIEEYLHQFSVNFEHEIGSGGGSGGCFSTVKGNPLLTILKFKILQVKMNGIYA
jgi:hypothetical protein